LSNAFTASRARATVAKGPSSPSGLADRPDHLSSPCGETKKSAVSGETGGVCALTASAINAAKLANACFILDRRWVFKYFINQARTVQVVDFSQKKGSRFNIGTLCQYLRITWLSVSAMITSSFASTQTCLHHSNCEPFFSLTAVVVFQPRFQFVSSQRSALEMRRSSFSIRAFNSAFSVSRRFNSS